MKMSRENESISIKNKNDGHKQFVNNTSKKLKNLEKIHKTIESDYHTVKMKQIAVLQMSKFEKNTSHCLKDCQDLKKTINFEINRIQKNIDKSDDKISELEYKKRYYASNSDKKRAKKYSDYIDMEYIRNRAWSNQLKESKSLLYKAMSLESDFEELIQTISMRKNY